jgi:N-acetyl-gamma-glutamyl-phosphate reductase
MVKVGIIGASGYTGYELVKILSSHPEAELAFANSESLAGRKVSDIYPDFEGDVTFSNLSLEEINASGAQVVFLAVPHGVATQIAPKLSCRVVDLSADYRFRDPPEYERIYKTEHHDKEARAIYGLPELFRKEIEGARLVANPGCYATGMMLSSLPIRHLVSRAIFDCKSGWSGAGKSSPYAKDPSLSKDNLIAYNQIGRAHV